MSGVRDTFQRNVDGLNDLFTQFKNNIQNATEELLEEGNFEEAVQLINDQIFAAILEFEKRNKSVKEILQTKLNLSFDDKNQGILTEWQNAIINAKSQLEMFGSTLREDLNKQVTEKVRIPAIEKFLLDAAQKKAFTRLTFDYIAKRLKVPTNKVEEIAENLIFDGKLPARIDLVSGTLIFSDVIEKLEQMTTAPTPPDFEPPVIPPAPKPPVIPPAPKPRRVSVTSTNEDMPQAISLDTPIDGPQPIDLSMEPPDMLEEITDTPPDALEVPTELDFDDIVELATGSKAGEAGPETPAEESSRSSEIPPPPVEADERISDPTISEEEKEARTLISFFKSSVEELSEEDKAEARRKREEKRKKLEEAKRKKKEQEEKVKLETPAPEPPKAGFRPAGDVTQSSGDLPTPPEQKFEELVKSPSPKTQVESIPADKKATCAICQKEVSKEDPTVIPCPHACGVYAHKTELLEKGYCPGCNEEVKDIDAEFSSLL